MLYGRICGIPESQVNKRASTVIKQVELGHHADKLTLVYCGGNRRKLALGISIIGDPSILLIDEPTSGLDPIASKRVWKSIADSSQNHSVFLATHSNSEAEALATRIVTISKGSLCPIFSDVNAVRSTGVIGRGFFTQNTKVSSVSVDIRLSSFARQANSLQSLMNEIDALFPQKIILERSTSLISFSCSRGPNTVSLGEMVEQIQSNILTFQCVESFRLCQGVLGLDGIKKGLPEKGQGQTEAQSGSSVTICQTNNLNRLSI